MLVSFSLRFHSSAVEQEEEGEKVFRGRRYVDSWEIRRGLVGRIWLCRGIILYGRDFDADGRCERFSLRLCAQVKVSIAHCWDFDCEYIGFKWTQ